MNTTTIITKSGHVVRIHDPLTPNTPEWEARQKRWEKATAEFMRKALREVKA